MIAWTYLLLLVAVGVGPLLAFFDPKKRFYVSLWPVVRAIAPVSIFFIGWDIWAVQRGHWHFLGSHTLGMTLAGLPLERWVFFGVIPFACLFFYQLGKRAIPYRKITLPLWLFWVGGGILMLMGLGNRSFEYTLVVGVLGGMTLWLVALMKPLMVFGNHYWWYMALSFLGLFLINSLLTGIPVVLYGEQFILGELVGTIPLEDFLHYFILLHWVLMLYEPAASKLTTPRESRVSH